MSKRNFFNFSGACRLLHQLADLFPDLVIEFVLAHFTARLIMWGTQRKTVDRLVRSGNATDSMDVTVF